MLLELVSTTLDVIEQADGCEILNVMGFNADGDIVPYPEAVCFESYAGLEGLHMTKEEQACAVWGVYLHVPGTGAVNIADVSTEEEANRLADCIEGLLKKGGGK